MKIAVTTSSFAQYSEEPLRLLREHGLEYISNPHGRTLNGEETAELLQNCAGVIAGLEPLNAKTLAALPQLRVISRCGVGLDNVDLEYAQTHGIQIFFTSDAPSGAVAELVLGYALTLCRRVAEMDRDLRRGNWKKKMGRLLAGSRVGIVGYGNIGKKVGRLFTALGCNVAFYDPYVQAADIERMELAELLKWCDLLTLHAPKQPDDRPLLDAAHIAMMRQDALLLNAARGGLVDEEALYAALKSGRLGGAALDVFEAEPYSGPLLELENVVLTPHIGSYAREVRCMMELEAVKNVLGGLGK